jgi:hypothetical protein
MLHDARLPEADIVQFFLGGVGGYLLVAEHDFVIENRLHVQPFRISLLDFLLKIMLLLTAFVSGCAS